MDTYLWILKKSYRTVTKRYSYFLMFYGKVIFNLIYLFTIFKQGETRLEERRKRKTLNAKALFVMRVPIIVVLTPKRKVPMRMNIVKSGV